MDIKTMLEQIADYIFTNIAPVVNWITNIDIALSQRDYIYSAMAQATGALIALVGIFIVYWLQIQRDRIRSRHGDVKNLVSRKYGSVQKTIEVAKAQLKQLKNLGKNEDYNELKGELDSLKNLIKEYPHKIKYGAYCILATTSVFVYYIVILHLHSKLPSPMLFFWVGLVVSICVVGSLGRFIFDVLNREGREYLGKEK